MGIFWSKSSKKETKSDSNQTNVVPKELPELAIEKYPLDSAFKKDEVKQVEAPVIVQTPTPPITPPVIIPEIKPEAVKKVIEPAPIPKAEPQKPSLDASLQVEDTPTQEFSQPINPVSDNPNFYFRNVTNINIPPPKGRYPEELLSDIENDTDNVRRELKNSFFSLIKEKMQKNEYHAIPDDSKLFLYEMRKHHESIAEKEKALKQKSLLDSALAEKITLLELLEEGWYLLRKEIETKQILLVEKEKLIDEITADLKSLMNKSGSFDKSFEKATSEKQRILSEDKFFILKNGRRLSSIADLKESLKHIDDDVFYHHVNSQKNDFSSWIRHVFMDANLADKILSAKSRHELIMLLDNWKEN